jgi:adenosylmethionine-8-amino-7-oxononanoate aminotransferase
MTDGRILFVTGTGTDVGKTVVAAALAHGLLQRRRAVSYWKPVETGGTDLDASVVKAGAGGAAPSIAPTAFSFSQPVSPDQAARADGRPPATVAALVAAAPRPQAGTWQIIEGAGGLLVPLNDAPETWLDLLHRTRWPTLVVAATGLGTLNHTSLTVRTLQQAGIPVAGIVLSGVPHPENEASLRRAFPTVPLHSLPHVTPGTDAYSAAAVALSQRVETTPGPRASSPEPEDWLAADRRHVWHPYTQHRTAPEPLPVVAASGIHLTLADGRRLVDATSSWWVNTIGHGRPEIARAIARQQAELDHVIFAGVTHAPAATLARRVAALAGGDLTRAFYSDNGSTAVEVALKICWQAWVNRGDAGRKTFLSFRGSYHGDTFGAMAVAAAGGFHGAFEPLLFRTELASPVTQHASALCPGGAAELAPRLAEIERVVEQRSGELAAVVLEPLVQGAGGMLVQPAEFLRGVERIARRHGLPLILDEVFTGLGRVGAAFAFQRAGLRPDVVCVAKGLTGGNLPLAITLATEELFAAFLADDKRRALLHGHSYTANPIACAAAHAALDIFASEDLPARARALEARYEAWIREAGAALGIRNPRALGGILAFELPGTRDGDYFHPAASRVPEVGARHGLFLRPLGNTVYLMPPLVIDAAETDAALRALASTVAELS